MLPGQMGLMLLSPQHVGFGDLSNLIGKLQHDGKGFVDSGCSRHMTGTFSNTSIENVDNGEPKTADDAQKQVEDGLNNENAEQERFADDSSSKDVNAIGAASPNKEENTEEEPEVDLENITNSYIVPTTPNTRIHKDYPINNVIGKVQSTYQTRRMLKPTSEQGFLSDVYEQKIHDTLNTCLYACFLSQIEPTSIAKALSDSSWVEAMHKELLQFKLQ
ncbi:hypothetical protein Tco_1129716 [Tanacetum coccineum]